MAMLVAAMLIEGAAAALSVNARIALTANQYCTVSTPGRRFSNCAGRRSTRRRRCRSR
jgi:hypothetical protein